MKLIKQSFEILDQQCGLEGIYKQIEIAGRTCYKSEDKITEDSAKGFVDRMIKSGHGAMLEHGSIYLQFKSIVHCFGKGYQGGLKYLSNPYSKVVLSEKETTQYVTTNYRVLIENNWLDDLKYLCEPTSFHEKRITVKFICDRGVSHEFVRHRVFSFAQESTRYCNYTKDKFNNELTFIIPCWFEWDEQTIHQGDFEKSGSGSEDSGLYINSLLNTEQCYKYLIKEGWKPQEARGVLPNALKTELVMTGFVSDWEHFFRVRSRIAETGKTHPQAQELAHSLHEAFIQRGLVK